MPASQPDASLEDSSWALLAKLCVRHQGPQMSGTPGCSLEPEMLPLICGHSSRSWGTGISTLLNHPFHHASSLSRGLPRWCSGKESACQCRRHKRLGFDPWIGKIPWGRKWQPTLVFLPGKFHEQRSLVDYSPWCCKESDMTE